MEKACLQSRPRGPAPNSPARKGWVHKPGGRAPEVRHYAVVCSLRAAAEGSAVLLPSHQRLPQQPPFPFVIPERSRGICSFTPSQTNVLVIPKGLSHSALARPRSTFTRPANQENCLGVSETADPRLALNEQTKSVAPAPLVLDRLPMDPALPGWAILVPALWAWIANTAFPCSFLP